MAGHSKHSGRLGPTLWPLMEIAIEHHQIILMRVYTSSTPSSLLCTLDSTQCKNGRINSDLLVPGGVGHDHMHDQNNSIFAKIFHVSPLVPVQKSNSGARWGLVDIVVLLVCTPNWGGFHYEKQCCCGELICSNNSLVWPQISCYGDGGYKRLYRIILV